MINGAAGTVDRDGIVRVVAEEPAGNDMLAGFAEIEKSGPTRTWRLRNLFPPPPLAVIVRL